MRIVTQERPPQPFRTTAAAHLCGLGFRTEGQLVARLIARRARHYCRRLRPGSREPLRANARSNGGGVGPASLAKGAESDLVSPRAAHRASAWHRSPVGAVGVAGHHWYSPGRWRDAQPNKTEHPRGPARQYLRRSSLGRSVPCELPELYENARCSTDAAPLLMPAQRMPSLPRSLHNVRSSSVPTASMGRNQPDCQAMTREGPWMAIVINGIPNGWRALPTASRPSKSVINPDTNAPVTYRAGTPAQRALGGRRTGYPIDQPDLWQPLPPTSGP
jgi:hypothetical protein